MLSGYALIIHEATGRQEPRELAIIEDCMRQDIFHSTLDWQTRTQLHEAASEAVLIQMALGALEPMTDAERAILPQLRAMVA